MRRVWIAVSALATAAVLAASPAASATLLNANWNPGCGKANCFDEHGVFKKVWSAADFHGPMTIGQLLLDHNILGDLDSSMFSIGFSLNGVQVGNWGHYRMAGFAAEQLGFSGENFVWNPSDGDLVLTLTIDLYPKFGGGGGGGGFHASAVEPDGDVTPSGGPTTGPTGPTGGTPDPTPPGPSGAPPSPAAAVPEPAAWTLMIGGFGLAGVALRQRRSRAAKA
ncbi:PEPxxWA-CTERM sorting domain-containing protein [Phenylobacterium sp.]|uniref:PEPxxWA-CTERM sorting domain-containing protein n=1 Tax=Phenylobacterium sp. TaxID=1871053 RepID=UPI0025EBB3B4|nr:PEPxxWA-CTERM sorting domain-containing protein [Phenylobacterium sp.]